MRGDTKPSSPRQPPQRGVEAPHKPRGEPRQGEVHDPRDTGGGEGEPDGRSDHREVSPVPDVVAEPGRVVVSGAGRDLGHEGGDPSGGSGPHERDRHRDSEELVGGAPVTEHRPDPLGGEPRHRAPHAGRGRPRVVQVRRERETRRRGDPHDAARHPLHGGDGQRPEPGSNTTQGVPDTVHVSTCHKCRHRSCTFTYSDDGGNRIAIVTPSGVMASRAVRISSHDGTRFG